MVESPGEVIYSLSVSNSFLRCQYADKESVVTNTFSGSLCLEAGISASKKTVNCARSGRMSD